MEEWSRGKYGGAKIAYNPGQISLRWRWIPEAFPDSKFIFVMRNEKDGYDSLVSKDRDKIYGVPSWEQYISYRQYLLDSFMLYYRRNPTTSILLDYDRMLLKPDEEFKGVWSTLGLPWKSIANQIQLPRHRSG